MADGWGEAQRALGHRGQSKGWRLNMQPYTTAQFFTRHKGMWAGWESARCEHRKQLSVVLMSALIDDIRVRVGDCGKEIREVTPVVGFEVETASRSSET